jgi:hypothetical protein
VRKVDQYQPSSSKNASAKQPGRQLQRQRRQHRQREQQLDRAPPAASASFQVSRPQAALHHGHGQIIDGK